MKLVDAQRLAINLMEEHGLIGKGWFFQFDNAISRFGCCKYRSQSITLSRTLVELNEIDEVKDTILHEIAHALVGPGHHHNEVWRAKALEIGCNGKRCYSRDEVVMPKARYEAVCGGCGVVHQKSRMVVRVGRKSACNCQSHKPWSDKILLTYIDTKLK
jgi:predicted SprT family Zn-dependent metalloprotease